MHWTDLPNWLNGVLVVATFVVVWFARQTVQEAKNATAEEKKTVDELKKLVVAAEQTAASSATTMQAARETAEISRAARDADHLHRQLEQLRAVRALVQDIREAAVGVKAAFRPQLLPPNWQATLDDLRNTLVGVIPPLPRCRRLAEVFDAGEIGNLAGLADTELRERFENLGAEGG